MGMISDIVFGTIGGQITFWLFLAIGVIGGTWAILFYIRFRSLKFTVFEFIDLGNGKVHIEKSKAGWLGKQTIFGNFINYGKQKVMKLKDGRIVRDFSTADYHQSKKGKALCVVSDPQDRKIVVPISNIRNLDKDLFLKLPPIDFQDAVLDNIRQTEKELKGFAETLVQLAIVGIIVFGGLVAIIFVIRYSQSAIREATDLIKSSSVVCQNAMTSAIESILSRPSPEAP